MEAGWLLTAPYVEQSVLFAFGKHTSGPFVGHQLVVPSGPFGN